MTNLQSHKLKFSVFLIVSEILFLILFAALVRYDDDAAPVVKVKSDENTRPEVRVLQEGNEPREHEEGFARDKLNGLYPMFQDVHVMIFVGFGFLMMFLKNYGFGAVSYNFLLSAFLIQYAIIVGGIVSMVVAAIDGQQVSGTILVGTETLFESDFTCAAVLISFGAVLGKLSGFQLLLMATFEVLFFKVNEKIGVHYLHAADMGGSMFVHVFGAYFGLALSRMMNSPSQRNRPTEGSDYKSDMFSLIGTIFLWIYWPSFNSAFATDEERVRAVLNTYIALCGSCVITFAVSALTDKDGKITIAHVQNATLAGGVAVGTCCNMMIHPAGAMAIGLAAGALSTVGFAYIQGILDRVIGLHDSCGVNNLHGMPGLLAGLCGIIAAAFASDDAYGDASKVFDDFKGGPDQAMRQTGALVITFVMAITGGLLSGLLIKVLPSSSLSKRQYYNDTDFWTEVEFTDIPESHSLTKQDESNI